MGSLFRMTAAGAMSSGWPIVAVTETLRAGEVPVGGSGRR
jgi:hypothetical protein